MGGDYNITGYIYARVLDFVSSIRRYSLFLFCGRDDDDGVLVKTLELPGQPA